MNSALRRFPAGRTVPVGIRAGDGGEGAEYWLHVFTELKNRGLDDVLMLVCDGLKDRPESPSAPTTSRTRARVGVDRITRR